MDIDIERLKTDAAYWDEVAPEDATHWCTLHNKWVYNPDWYDECCIPLPTKPVAPEWVDGLPPIGSVVEFTYVGLNWEGRTCRVLGIHDETNRIWLHIKGNEESKIYHLKRLKFRPIRTKEQRQRDELVDFVATASGIRARDGRGAIALDIADAILARYSLEPKDD